jgi:hypothetical protein
MTQHSFGVALALASCLTVSSIAAAQTKPAARKTTLTGTLTGGRIAIGGETSGWELTYRDKTGEHTIEVEFSPSLLGKIHDGETARVTGTIVTRERVERGRVPTLVASAVEEIRARKQ